jgi:cyclopropane-fatty-acyl-phospholipid synthase
MGCAVDTITLSKEQKMQADERIAAAGLAESVRVHLCDYRELPPAFEHSFDACISCEMLEVSTVFEIHLNTEPSITRQLAIKTTERISELSTGL